MIIEKISNLKINKLSEAQYERELAAGNINENELYLTPDEGLPYHTHEIEDVNGLEEALKEGSGGGGVGKPGTGLNSEIFNDYDGNVAEGEYSHAEGYHTTASGNYGSHTEGFSTTASGNCSHAEGGYTKASGEYQHVQGKFNIEDTESKYAHIVGNGTYDNNTGITTHSNAHTLDWDGNAWFAGDVQVTAPDGTTVSVLALLQEINTLKSTIASLQGDDN